MTQLELKTQIRILKLFGHKICSSCGSQAERFFDGKPLCQKCFLIQKIQAQIAPQISAPRVFTDPFPEFLTDAQEMNE